MNKCEVVRTESSYGQDPFNEVLVVEFRLKPENVESSTGLAACLAEVKKYLRDTYPLRQFEIIPIQYQKATETELFNMSHICAIAR